MTDRRRIETLEGQVRRLERLVEWFVILVAVLVVANVFLTDMLLPRW